MFRQKLYVLYKLSVLHVTREDRKQRERRGPTPFRLLDCFVITDWENSLFPRPRH
jgi:hypothetical protein